MLRSLSALFVLYVFWLLLSGFFTPFLLVAGFCSALAVLLFSRRMDVVDHEGHPVHLGWRALFSYWPWLALQILLSNLDVARRVLSPSLPISPRLFVLRAGQGTDLGQVIYANSITLTPGTVTVEIENRELVVHALTEEAAQSLRSGAMDRRVTALEGRR